MLVVTSVVIALFVGTTPPAEAAPACAITEQLTATIGGGFNGGAAADADGSRIAFASTKDLTGQNPDLTREVFLVDRTADTTTQLTPSLPGDAGLAAVSISDDGTKVAFIAVADYVGENPDNIDQVFLVDTTTATLSQLTDIVDPFEVSDPDLSADGNRIVFRSNANLTGTNADGTQEIFRMNTVGPPATVAVTNSATGASNRPSANTTGSRIAFDSTANLVPANGNADANLEIFVADPAGPTTVQLTNTTGAVNSSSPVLNAAGTQVTFQSQANLTGANADANIEVFRRSVTSSAVTQLSDTSSGSSQIPRTDASGNRVVLISDSVDQPRATDTTRNAYVADAGQAGVSPVTSAGSLRQTDRAALSGDGRVVALVSQTNPLGTNADGSSELFVALCGSATPSFSDVPATSASFGAIQWLTGTGLAGGFPNGTFKPRDEVKRQQMASILYRLAGEPTFTPPATPTFSDVPASNPFYEEIEWMVDEGITTGFANGTFKPKNTVKRQQVADFLYTIAGEPLFSPPGTPTFSDVSATSPNFLQIEWLVDEGVTEGFADGTFKPKNTVKRQQIASIIHAFAVSPGPGQA